MSTTQSILVVDDDAHIGEFISTVVSSQGIPCAVVADAASFFEQLNPTVTIVMVDLVMPEVDGVELLRLLAHRKSPPKVILMSGLGDRVIETAKHLAEAMGLCVVGHLRKPFRLLELEEMLYRCETASIPSRPQRKPGPVISDQEIASALDKNEFILHYQPQVELSSGRVISIEALSRWQHPTHGLLYPDSFIDRIEALGLMQALTWNVAALALKEIGSFRMLTGETPKLSLNVSVNSLLDLNFPDKFCALAKEHAIAMEDIVLEITESGLVGDSPETFDVLARLRMKNVDLSIDDFGTGFSMMQQLKTIPATELKIDKAFVQNAERSKSDRVMVIKTIEIGHELGLRVIAEGVETAEQLDFVRKSGCDIVQGYYFTRPLPAVSLANWLKEYREGKAWIVPGLGDHDRLDCTLAATAPQIDVQIDVDALSSRDFHKPAGAGASAPAPAGLECALLSFPSP